MTKIKVLSGFVNTGSTTTGWTDYTGSLLESSFSITGRIGSDIDVLTLTFYDEDLTNSILEGHDLIIEDAVNENVRFFGGVVVDIVKVDVGKGRRIQVTVQDYTVLMDKATIRKTYVAGIGWTDRAIIMDAMVESGRSEINTQNVKEGRILDSMQFSGTTMRSLLDTMAEITGFMWVIDYFKNLHYGPRDNLIIIPTTYKTLSFSDTSDNILTHPYYASQYNRRLAQWNVVTIQGGKAVSQDKTDAYSNDGVETVFHTGQQSGTNEIDRPPSGNTTTPVISKNTGSDGTPVWEAQTVGIEQDSGVTLGSGGIDVIWNAATRRIEFDVAPPNFANNSWQIIGRYLLDNLVTQVDPISLFTHGRAFIGNVIVPEALTQEQAYDLAIAFLRENSDREFISFRTNKEGLCLCQTLRFTNSNLSLNNRKVVIQSLTTRIIGGEVYEFAMEGEIIN